MTRPKRWYLDGSDEEENGMILCNSDGPYKKPNASAPLGIVLMVSVATEENKEKFSKEEAVLFQCRQGRIVLSIKHHEWNKTDVSSYFKNVKTSSDFVAVWKQIQYLHHVPSEKHHLASDKESLLNEELPIASESSSMSSSSSSSLHQTSSLSNDSFPPAKKKIYSSDIDDEIENQKVGLIQIPVANLQKPPRESRLMREPDPTFVRNLKENMIKDPAGPGASTVAVLCKNINKPEDFQEKYKIVYKYEVLGGLHTYLAKLQLTQEYPECSFYKYVNADVYVGLSDEQALRLAQRHNQNAHFVHKITHRDLIETCRARLYKLASKEMNSNVTPAPSSYWKESCKTAIIPQNISSTQQDAIFHQASLPKQVWDLLLQIMDLFEEGKLKGQKLNLSKLLSKPEFKQHYITPIRALCETDQCALLQSVVKKEISLTELKELAATKKSMYALKTAFVKLTNSDSWEKAIETFPNYATEARLHRFLGCDLKKNIPKPFYDYCHEAKTSEAGISITDHESRSVISFDCIDGPPVTAVLIKGKLTDITGHTIQKVKSSFSGVDLAIVLIDEQNLEEVDNITFTLKEINAIGGKTIYNIAGICSPAIMHLVKEAWERAFEHSEYLFVADKSSTKRSTNFLTECVTTAIISHHSVDGTTFGFNYAEGERLNFTKVDSNKMLMSYLINHFCCPGGTVLEYTKTGGMACLATLETNKSVVSVVQSEKELEDAYALISTLKH